MKKIGWIFGWLPLIGIAIYYYNSPPNPTGGVKDSHVSTPTTNKVGPTTQQKWAEYKRAQNEETKQKIDQTDLNFQKLKENIAELAMDLTPSVQSKLVDATLKAREPRYRSLLDSWNIDPSTTNQVFQVIRERDAELQALRADFFRNGASSLSDYQGKLRDASDKAKKTLVGVLGQNRTAALGKLEAQMAPALASSRTVTRNGDD